MSEFNSVYNLTLRCLGVDGDYTLRRFILQDFRNVSLLPTYLQLTDRGHISANPHHSHMCYVLLY